MSLVIAKIASCFHMMRACFAMNWLERRAWPLQPARNFVAVYTAEMALLQAHYTRTNHKYNQLILVIQQLVVLLGMYIITLCFDRAKYSLF